MKVEYSNRAVADLKKIAADSLVFGKVVAIAVEARIRKIIERIAEQPESAQRVTERPGVRVVPLIHYPYKVFYRVLDDRVRILHIRHTSRRPWISDR
jgi:plasmid stabilization system protein ParE